MKNVDYESQKSEHVKRIKFTSSQNKFNKVILVNNSKRQAFIHFGSDCSLISLQLAQDLKLRIENLPKNIKLSGFLGNSSTVNKYEEANSYTINLNTEEVATVCAGKDFGLLRTVTGKVLYTGKSSALGIKQAGIRTGKWAELILTKSPKITHISMGHDGLHAVLVTEDGAVFFTGTARRGEDGD